MPEHSRPRGYFKGFGSDSELGGSHGRLYSRGGTRFGSGFSRIPPTANQMAWRQSDREEEAEPLVPSTGAPALLTTSIQCPEPGVIIGFDTVYPSPKHPGSFFPSRQSWAGKGVLTQDEILNRSICVPAAKLPKKGMDGVLTDQIT